MPVQSDEVQSIAPPYYFQEPQTAFLASKIVTEIGGEAVNTDEKFAQIAEYLTQRYGVIDTDVVDGFVLGLKQDISSHDDDIARRLSTNLSAFLIEHGDADYHEKLLRREFVESNGFLPLSDILSVHFDSNEESAFIHLAPARMLTLEQRLKSVTDGLHKLAMKITIDEDLSKLGQVNAISWYVTKHPNHMQYLGFSVVGPISEEIKIKIFHDSDPSEKINAAHISRQDLLEKYLGS
ncbi:MAG: hypothetical protein QG593_447 [Patescibacteria group bacterium]|nr:hypothetical protein [Patescibacteria group bacterium]